MIFTEQLISKYKIKNKYILYLNKLQFLCLYKGGDKAKNFELFKDLVFFIFDNKDFFKNIGLELNYIVNNYLKDIALNTLTEFMTWGMESKAFLPIVILLDKKFEYMKEDITNDDIRYIEIFAQRHFANSDRALGYRYKLYYKLFYFYIQRRCFLINTDKYVYGFPWYLEKIISNILKYKSGKFSNISILKNLEKLDIEDYMLDGLEELYCFLIDIELLDIAMYMFKKADKSSLLKDIRLIYYSCKLLIKSDNYTELNKYLLRLENSKNKSDEIIRFLRLIKFDTNKILLTNIVLDIILSQISLNDAEIKIITKLIMQNHNKFLSILDEDKIAILTKIYILIERLLPNKIIINLHFKLSNLLLNNNTCVHNFNSNCFFEKLSANELFNYLKKLNKAGNYSYENYIKIFYLCIKKGCDIEQLKDYNIDYKLYSSVEKEHLYIIKLLCALDYEEWWFFYYIVLHPKEEKEKSLSLFMENYNEIIPILKKYIFLNDISYSLEIESTFIKYAVDILKEHIKSNNITSKKELSQFVVEYFKNNNWNKKLFSKIMKELIKELKTK